ncbi:hypothetical protein ACQJBY_044586 [Aegilops geniculata]
MGAFCAKGTSARRGPPLPSVPVPEKLSEESQKPEGAVPAAGQSQEKWPDKVPETVESSDAAGQLQEKPPGEASKTGKASGVQPLTAAYFSHAATTVQSLEESKMKVYETEKSSKKNDTALSPRKPSARKFN